VLGTVDARQAPAPIPECPSANSAPDAGTDYHTRSADVDFSEAPRLLFDAEPLDSAGMAGVRAGPSPGPAVTLPDC